MHAADADRISKLSSANVSLDDDFPRADDIDDVAEAETADTKKASHKKKKGQKVRFLRVGIEDVDLDDAPSKNNASAQIDSPEAQQPEVVVSSSAPPLVPPPPPHLPLRRAIAAGLAILASIGALATP